MSPIPEAKTGAPAAEVWRYALDTGTWTKLGKEGTIPGAALVGVVATAYDSTLHQLYLLSTTQTTSPFGTTTALSYAWSGLVSWGLAGLFIAGGVAGGLAGTRSARLLSERRGALNVVFAAIIIAVALYMLARNISHVLA